MLECDWKSARLGTDRQGNMMAIIGRRDNKPTIVSEPSAAMILKGLIRKRDAGKGSQFIDEKIALLQSAFDVAGRDVESAFEASNQIPCLYEFIVDRYNFG